MRHLKYGVNSAEMANLVQPGQPGACNYIRKIVNMVVCGDIWNRVKFVTSIFSRCFQC